MQYTKLVSKTFALTIFLLGMNVANAGPLEFYSQSTTEDRTSNPVMFSRLNWEITDANINGRSLRPYVGTGFNVDQKSEGRVIYNDNYAYLSLGATYSLMPNLSLFVEHRQVINDFGVETGRSKQDPRGGAYFYNRKESTALPLFTEGYSEMVYSYRQDSDVFFMGRGRTGALKSFSSSLSGELLAEATLKMDTLGHFYENKLEVGPMVRLRYQPGQFSIDLTAGHTFGRYLGREYIDPIPADKSFDQWQATLALYGRW